MILALSILVTGLVPFVFIEGLTVDAEAGWEA
jgi:hypothetical protein